MGIFQSIPNWIIIDNHKYDMTDLLKYHPGGTNIIKEAVGKDCTLYYREHHGHTLDTNMEKYRL